ncbi:hypothetical protein IEQ34_026928 [Dendrobium chrysotoxum]|uniref:Uncharacterized protein n=1 Tax=Dendrobium chrysotoxum TaxID=161865 RepID=A0AAV7FIG7_DENCH|nr:hypothetical protein IEQ34_026928 [Dendrobium chrysotoxum]
MSKVRCLKSTFNGNAKYHVAREDWFEEGVTAEDGGLFPCLIELVLRDCLILKRVALFAF